jgi:regulator of protease activity HflC (stomatin/prohibitin superfamily)
MGFIPEQEISKVTKFYSPFCILFIFLFLLAFLTEKKLIPSIYEPFFIKMYAFLVFAIAVIASIGRFTRIPENNVGMLIRLGKRTDQYLAEGLHFLYPWEKVQLFPTTIQKLDVEAQLWTRGPEVTIQSEIFFRPDKENLKGYTDVQGVVNDLLQGTVKSFFTTFEGSIGLEELLNEKGRLANSLLNYLNSGKEMLLRNVEIIAIHLMAFKLPKAVAKARSKVTEELYRQAKIMEEWAVKSYLISKVKEQNPDMSEGQILENILISEGKIQKKVIKIEGLDDVVSAIFKEIKNLRKKT